VDRETTPTVARLTLATDRAFDALVRIYKAALPASERKGVEALRTMLARPDYEFLVAWRDEEVVGFAIVVRLAGCQACLLEYMAVDVAHRGRGIGAVLFRASAASVGAQTLLLEVEAEDAAAPDAEERVRRRAFYRRLGCRLVDGLRYLMPPVTWDRPPSMGLFVFRDSFPTTIRRTELQRWLECLYVSVYGRSPDDPLIGEMVGPLPAEIPLI
jgi:GNAT superfamily N-acetyltransferase